MLLKRLCYVTLQNKSFVLQTCRLTLTSNLLEGLAEFKLLCLIFTLPLVPFLQPRFRLSLVSFSSPLSCFKSGFYGCWCYSGGDQRAIESLKVSKRPGSEWCAVFLFCFYKKQVIIPKPDTDPHTWSNYCPISLLKTCVKIHAKILATRLNFFLGKLVHKEQVGFVPLRGTGDDMCRPMQLIHLSQIPLKFSHVIVP